MSTVSDTRFFIRPGKLSIPDITDTVIADVIKQGTPKSIEAGILWQRIAARPPVGNTAWHAYTFDLCLQLLGCFSLDGDPFQWGQLVPNATVFTSVNDPSAPNYFRAEDLIDQRNYLIYIAKELIIKWCWPYDPFISEKYSQQLEWFHKLLGQYTLIECWREAPPAPLIACPTNWPRPGNNAAWQSRVKQFRANLIAFIVREIIQRMKEASGLRYKQAKEKLPAVGGTFCKVSSRTFERMASSLDPSVISLGGSEELMLASLLLDCKLETVRSALLQHVVT